MYAIELVKMGDPESANVNKNHNQKIDEILKYINRHFVSLHKGECAHVNIILNNAVQSIIDNMILSSQLFSFLYEELSFGGSYYCGLKIKKPDEFDIDIKLHIPDYVNPRLFIDENSGFLQIMLQNIENIDSKYKRELMKLVDEDNYLVQNKAFSWVYSLICKSINRVNINYPGCVITPFYNGPAVRLNVCYNRRIFDIDLVLSFVFSEQYWPDTPFRSCQSFEKKTFLTVPKKPKFCTRRDNRYFRFSFQEQENEYLSANYHGKPVFRLLKKLRDTQMHSTSSYVLKTIFLWEVDKRKRENNEEYWRLPLSTIFFDMLESYKNYMNNHEVPYFWNPNENLIVQMKQDTRDNIANFLQRMINKINSYIEEDIYIFAKYLLNQHEYRQLVHHFRGTSYECSRNDDYYYQEVLSSIHSH